MSHEVTEDVDGFPTGIARTVEHATITAPYYGPNHHEGDQHEH